MTNPKLPSKPTFGGHETFVFRDGWLKKGVDAVAVNPAIFADDEALVVLGVGKNMVRSIRYWCLATSICRESHGADRRRMVDLTTLGSQLLLDDGWDPFLEDIGTLWLIHWQLASNVDRALIWNLVFSRFYEVEFSKAQLAQFLQKQFERLDVITTSGMINREIDCFVRTYTPTRSNSQKTSEESFDCPLTELDLLRFVSEDNIYRFNVGPKPSLPIEVFTYALFHYLEGATQHRRTVAVDECVYGEGRVPCPDSHHPSYIVPECDKLMGSPTAKPLIAAPVRRHRYECSLIS